MEHTFESWRPVPGYEGRYEVSDQGRVRSHASGSPVLLKPGRASNGYYTVALRRREPGQPLSTSRSWPVQHLVAAAFIGPRPPGALVLHRDGTRDNNRLDNLRYGTGADNAADVLRHGGRKWTEAQIRELKARLKAGEPPLKLAAEYGMHHPQVYLIRKGGAYAWV